MQTNVSDAQLIEAYQRLGSTLKVSKELGISDRSVRRRKVKLNHKLHIPITVTKPVFYRREHNARTDCTIENGVFLIGSDVHIWPGELTVGQKSFISVAESIQPSGIFLNGDVFDGAGISRWPKSSFGHKLPTVKEELDAVHLFLNQVKKASPFSKRWWLICNHDMRFESKLANLVPEFEGVPGFSLQEQFPEWPMSISMMVNNNLMIKHRYHNGIHRWSATFKI